MKKQAYTMIAMIVLVGSMVVAAQAQTGGRTQLVAHVPFAFTVGNQTLPAGDYEVRTINADSANVLLKIQSRDGKAGAMVQMMTVQAMARGTAELTFNRYGNQYFFAQVYLDGENSKLQSPKSRAERASERELAGTRMTRASVALSASR